MGLLDTYVKLQGLRQQQEQQQLQQVHSILYLADAARKIRDMDMEDRAAQATARVPLDIVNQRPGEGMTGMEEYDVPNPEQMITETTPKTDEQYAGDVIKELVNERVSSRHIAPWIATKRGAVKERITKEEEARKNPMLTSEQLTGKAPLPMMPASTAYHYRDKEKEAKIPQSVAGAWIQGRAKELMAGGIEENTALKQASDEARAKGFDEKQTLINIRQDQGPSAASNRRVSTGLRKEFNNLGPVKEYREVENKFNVMDKAFAESKKTGNFVAVDQALITLYNKMTDPSSVVRESEYVRTPQDMAVMNRVKAAVARVGKGGRLEPDTRQALMTMASKFREVYAGKYVELADEYRDYARGYGVEPEMVVSKKATDRASKTIAQPAPTVNTSSKFKILKVE